MVLVSLPSDALSQHLPSYLDLSYLVCGVSLHGCSSKAQPLLLILDEGYLLMAAPPDLEHGVAPLGPPAPEQLPLLGTGVAPLGRSPCPRAWGSSSRPPPLPSGVWGRGILCHPVFCSMCCLCTCICTSLPLWRCESTPSLRVPAPVFPAPCQQNPFLH